jgi:hypothetical protein
MGQRSGYSAAYLRARWLRDQLANLAFDSEEMMRRPQFTLKTLL